MSEPTTAAGRALLEREAYNSRSFALITPEAIAAVEAEAIAAYRADLAAKVRKGRGFFFGSCGGWGCEQDRAADFDFVLALIEEEPR